MMLLLLAATACTEPYEQYFCPDGELLLGDDCVPLDELLPEDTGEEDTGDPQDTGPEGCPEYDGEVYIGIDADACEVPAADQAVSVTCDEEAEVWNFEFWTVGAASRVDVFHRYIYNGTISNPDAPVGLTVTIQERQEAGYWTSFAEEIPWESSGSHQQSFGYACERDGFDHLWEVRMYDDIGRPVDCIVWGQQAEVVLDAEPECRAWTGATG